jgi:hypothetical protein
MRGRYLTGMLTACLAAFAGPFVFAALAGPIEVPIPGLSGGLVQVAGAERTAGGGGVIAARITSGPGAQRGALTVARVQADGAVNLAYGTLGIAQPPVDARLAPTALTVDPSGAAWIGAQLGSGGAGEVIALDATGAPLRAFGTAGVLRLPAADQGGPVALALSGGRLLIAAGTVPCHGCQLSIRDANTGRVQRSVTLPAATLAPAPCRAAVTGAAFAGRAVLLSTATRGKGCSARIAALGAALQPPSPDSPPAPQLSYPNARSSMLVPDGSRWCLSASGEAHVNLLSQTQSGRWTAAAGPAGALVALVPLGPGACAALIRTARSGALVAQMSAGGPAVTSRVPGGLAPLGMFRCNAHLLVIAAVDRGRSAVIVPVAIRRGAFAHTASAASARTLSTGCT